MYKNISAAIVICLLMICGGTASAQAKVSTALELNDFFSASTDSLFVYGTGWGNSLAEAIKSGDYHTMRAARIGIEGLVDRKTMQIGATPNVGGSEAFKAAMLHFMAFEKEMIVKYFIPFEKLTKTSKDEEKNALLQKIQDVSKDEEAELDAVRKAQDAYAKRNGLTIEKQ